jgi:hypothetical protein
MEDVNAMAVFLPWILAAAESPPPLPPVLPVPDYETWKWMKGWVWWELWIIILGGREGGKH